jgi:hypothetical protein
MTIKQLYNVIRASSERYMSVESEASCRLIKITEDADRIIEEADAFARWTPFYQFCQVDLHYYEPVQVTRKMVYEIGRKQGYRLVEEPEAVIRSKEPPVKTGGILEFKQSLAAVFFALHLNILLYRRFLYANR